MGRRRAQSPARRQPEDALALEAAVAGAARVRERLARGLFQPFGLRLEVPGHTEKPPAARQPVVVLEWRQDRNRPLGDGFPNTPKHPASYYQSNDWTDGCIALSNSDMVEVWMRTQDNIPIDIYP